MRVENMSSPQSGRPVANQFIIHGDNGVRVFQSYGTVIARIDRKGNITLDREKWDYSVTTAKYRNQFLGMNKAEIVKAIGEKRIKLANLN